MGEALKLLSEEVRQQLAAHPWGHLLTDRRQPLTLTLSIPLETRNGELLRAELDSRQTLTEGVEALLAHRALFQPGAVFCLRCSRAECDHARPTNPREVFAGYGPTGIPRFLELGQWLLESRDPRVNLLYGERPDLITFERAGDQLSKQLLPIYRDRKSGFHLHGQVAAGFYTVRDASGDSHTLAVTFQLISSGKHPTRRRFGLNVLGSGPHGESLSDLQARLGYLPWEDALRWGREALESVEKAAARPKGLSRTILHRRLHGLMSGLARRLEKSRRSQKRRTLHAQQRHTQGDRPTDMAMADLRQAGNSDFLFDIRNKTLIVLGAKSRAHVFSLVGKHVTSVRYGPPAIERRLERGQWRPASSEERLEMTTALANAGQQEENQKDESQKANS